MDSEKLRRTFFGSCVFLIAVSIAYILLILIQVNPWAYSDSVEYMAAARSFALGKGLVITAPSGGMMPVSLHPPLYSLLLAPAYLLNLSPFVWIKYLNALMLVVGIIYWGICIYRFLGSAALGLICSALLGYSLPILKDFNGSMSEPLYILLTLLQIGILTTFLNRKTSLLYWSLILVSALLPLTRYIGVINIVVGFLAILLWLREEKGIRIKKAVIYAFFSVLPIAIWLLTIAFRNGSDAPWRLQLDNSLKYLFYKIFSTILNLFPGIVGMSWSTMKILLGIIACTFLVGIVMFFYLLKRDKNNGTPIESGNILLIISAIFCVGYVLFLLLTSFTATRPDINDRMMSPLLPFIIVVVLGGIYQIFKMASPHPVIKCIPLFLGLILLIADVRPIQEYIFYRNTDEFSYSSLDWESSPLLRAIKSLPEDQPLISNEAPVILLYTNRFPYEMSVFKDSQKVSIPTPFGSGVTNEEGIFRNGGALVVFKSSFKGNLIKIYGDQGIQLSSDLLNGLYKACDYQDGAIYFYEPYHMYCP